MNHIWFMNQDLLKIFFIFLFFVSIRFVVSFQYKSIRHIHTSIVEFMAKIAHMQWIHFEFLFICCRLAVFVTIFEVNTKCTHIKEARNERIECYLCVFVLKKAKPDSNIKNIYVICRQQFNLSECLRCFVLLLFFL